MTQLLALVVFTPFVGIVLGAPLLVASLQGAPWSNETANYALGSAFGTVVVGFTLPGVLFGSADTSVLGALLAAIAAVIGWWLPASYSWNHRLQG